MKFRDYLIQENVGIFANALESGNFDLVIDLLKSSSADASQAIASCNLLKNLTDKLSELRRNSMPDSAAAGLIGRIDSVKSDLVSSYQNQFA